MLWFPVASATDADRFPLELCAMFTESMYMIIAVTGYSLSSAAAVNCTGEATVAPGAGEQIFTERSAVAAHDVPPVLALDTVTVVDDVADCPAEFVALAA